MCGINSAHIVDRNPQSAVVRTAEGRRWVRAYACIRFEPKRGRFGCFEYVVGVCARTHYCIRSLIAVRETQGMGWLVGRSAETGRTVSLLCRPGSANDCRHLRAGQESGL